MAISLSGTDLAGKSLKVTMSHSPINSPPASSSGSSNSSNSSRSHHHVCAFFLLVVFVFVEQ